MLTLVRYLLYQNTVQTLVTMPVIIIGMAETICNYNCGTNIEGVLRIWNLVGAESLEK